MKISPRSTLVMIGDSITEWGREEPLSDVPDDLLGNGYVHYVDILIGAGYPGHRLRIRNMGIGGNTVRDLEARWTRHVLDLKPDWVSVLIGINDVWGQFDLRLPPARQISIEEYEAAHPKFKHTKIKIVSPASEPTDPSWIDPAKWSTKKARPRSKRP